MLIDLRELDVAIVARVFEWLIDIVTMVEKH